jgi:hypothetical protein
MDSRTPFATVLVGQPTLPGSALRHLSAPAAARAAPAAVRQPGWDNLAARC